MPGPKPSRWPRRTRAIVLVTGVVVLAAGAAAATSGSGQAGEGAARTVVAASADDGGAGAAGGAPATTDAARPAAPTEDAPGAERAEGGATDLTGPDGPDGAEPDLTETPLDVAAAPADEDVELPPLGTDEPVLVGLDAAGTSGGLEGRVTDVSAVVANASGPGELGGPAVLLAVELVNRTGREVVLDDVGLTAYLGEQAWPMSPVGSDPRSEPLGGTVAPGATVTGRYVLALPPAAAKDSAVLSVLVLVAPDQAPIAFQGAVVGLDATAR